jgi:hypothetical protein
VCRWDGQDRWSEWIYVCYVVMVVVVGQGWAVRWFWCVRSEWSGAECVECGGGGQESAGARSDGGVRPRRGWWWWGDGGGVYVWCEVCV